MCELIRCLYEEDARMQCEWCPHCEEWVDSDFDDNDEFDKFDDFEDFDDL